MKLFASVRMAMWGCIGAGFLLLGCGARSDLGGTDAGTASGAGGGSASTASGGGGAGGAGANGGAGGTACVPATTDTFDPREVYFVGTLFPGSGQHDAVAHWCNAEIGAAGFEFGPSQVAIRPTDGRMIRYESTRSAAFEFRCDGCPVTSFGDYPEDPWLNDVPVPLVGCAEPSGILMSPEGEVITQCGGDPPSYFDSSGALLYPTPDSVDPILVHLGYGGLGLTEGFVVDLRGGLSAPIEGLPVGLRGAVRAAPDGGFWAVVSHEAILSLFHISSAGSAELIGDYPPPPSSVFVDDAIASYGRLDGEARLFQVGEYVGNDVLLRRDLAGASDVVHDDGTDPRIKLWSGHLVTGP